MIYNKGQEQIIREAVEHIKHTKKQVYQISGAPGTGKTEVIKEIVRRVGIPLNRVAPMAYVGQAASVMRMRGLYNARTCHSWLYELKEVELVDENGNPIMDTVFNKPQLKLKFVPKKLENIDYIIIDEASTVPLRMKYEIERRGLPIIAIGDINQLPPVKDQPAYLVDGEIHYLTEIMRQKAGSGVVYLSNRILNGKPINPGIYKEVMVIERKYLTDTILRNSQIVLCGTNRTRDYMNNHIRGDIYGIKSKTPLTGERVICRKNNWNIEIDGISLTNGLTGTVLNNISVEDYDGEKFYIDFKPDALGNYYPRLGCNYKYFNADYQQRLLYKMDPYLQGELFELAYAITTHLSQGGQYWNGVYIQEYLSRDIQKNLDYTGITRFINSCVYVIPDRKKFF